MRKALCVAVVVVLAWTSVAVAQEAVFRGLRWGDPLSLLGEVTQVAVEDTGIPGLAFWRKVNEDLVLGGVVPVESIGYGFLDGELAAIVIVGGDYKALSGIARARYGRPTPAYSTADSEVYVMSESVCVVARDGQGGLLMLMSGPLFYAFQNHEQWQIEEAAKEFQ
ncbi:MAG TPA: hypothetical protein GX515_05005 [Firmicutes bacterium]|nr:hypothetical protein [Bacillota bacterium]